MSTLIRGTARAKPAPSGPALISSSLDATKEPARDSVDIAVLHVPTPKPLEEAPIVREARRSGRLVVVAENHTKIGGLGEAVAATLMRAGVTAAFRQIALPDRFLDAGSLPVLQDRYGICRKAVIASIKGWL